MSQADRNSSPSADVTVSAFVALRAHTAQARRILGASMMLLPTSDAAGLIRELEQAGLNVSRE